jgi:hypothetical protein
MPMYDPARTGREYEDVLERDRMAEEQRIANLRRQQSMEEEQCTAALRRQQSARN